MKTIIFLIFTLSIVIDSSYSIVHNDCPSRIRVNGGVSCKVNSDCGADQACCGNQLGVEVCTAKCHERMLKCQAGYTRDFKYNPLTGCNDAYCKAPVKLSGNPICSLPKEIGRCRAHFVKYYFDSAKKSCEPFGYGGCGGNQNNFDNLDDCEDACILQPNSSEFDDDFDDDDNNNQSNERGWNHQQITFQSSKTGNDCHEPVLVGPCRARKLRYYFDRDSNSCRDFYYGGCGGNNNNFESLSACKNKCENQQQATTPVSSVVASPLEASTDDNKNVDRCLLPVEIGMGRAYIERFHFNSETKNCEKFGYGGSGGNDNNFKTIEECNSKCKLSTEPTVAMLSTLPKKCTHPKAQGMCLAYFERYYFDTTTNKCTKFVFGGCQGNENNFYSKEECEQQCQAEKICNLPIDAGICYARIPKYGYNSKTKQCEEFTYHGCEGNSNKFETKEDCQKVCGQVSNSIVEQQASFDQNDCNLQPETGLGRAHKTNYFYNSANGNCETFVYGGVGGNKNNFNTIEECQSACSSKTVRSADQEIFVEATNEIAFDQNDCELEPETGLGRAHKINYFYNSANESCETFVYGGVGGNNNNFNTVEECQKACGSRSDTQNEVTFDPESCKLEPETGVGRAYFERYYYNSTAKKCEIFVYGGMGGNDNNFKTIEECQNKCT